MGTHKTGVHFSGEGRGNEWRYLVLDAPPPPSIVGCRGTFEPKRRGVTLDQVAFGAVLGAQGRAWPEPRREWKVKRKEEEDENSEKENGLETAIKYANQWTAYVTAATAIVWSRHSKEPHRMYPK